MYYFLLRIFLFFISSAIFCIPVEHEILYSKLNSPTAIQILPNNAILVAERTGKLKLVSENKTTIIHDFNKEIFTNTNSGLLDIKLDSDFKNNNILYISYSAYTDKKSKRYLGLVLAKARLKEINQFSNAPHYKLESIKILHKIKYPIKKKHSFGGSIYVTDDHIYLSVGNRGYTRASLSSKNTLGKIIRIKKDGSIPRTNPFYFSKKFKPETFSYGHKTIYSLGYDPFFKRLFSLETSPNNGCILNTLEPGKNYNWSLSDDKQELIAKNENMQTKPFYWWDKSFNPSSMIVYFNKQHSFLNGDMFITSQNNMYLKWIIVKNKKIIKQHTLLQDLNLPLSSIAVGDDGSIYIATSESKNASIMKLKFKQ